MPQKGWVDFIPQKILLIEKDQTLAQVLKFSLIKEGYEVDLFSGDALGVRDLNNNSYDMILYDVHLPSKRKINAIERLKAGGCNIPIVLLGQYANEETVVAALKLGADDYIRKPFGISVLSAKIEAVLKHYVKHASRLKVSTEEKAFRVSDIEVYPERFEIAALGKKTLLKEKEFAIFVCLLQSGGNICRLEQIRNEAWTQGRVHDVTLRGTVCSLREKLACFHHIFEIQTMKKIGYKLNFKSQFKL